MTESIRFSYIDVADKTNILPYLPIQLNYHKNMVTVSALVDSGSTINVLPYSIGLQLGLKWEQQTMPITLTGNLARLPAKGVVISGQVGQLSPVELAFAWTQSDDISTILGQVNFFAEFDVCFFRSIGEFEIRHRG